jgi:hypothetical protein
MNLNSSFDMMIKRVNMNLNILGLQEILLMETPKPIKLIELSAEGEFSISEEAMNTLKELGNKQIAPIIIAGPLRRNIRSLFINQKEELSIPENTKGIWMWNQPIKLPDGKGYALIMNVEGLDTSKAKEKLKILSLSLLLSSVVVYNTSGSIIEESWSDLSELGKLQEIIRIKSESNEFVRDFSKYAPSFVWVLHDSIESKEQFEDALKSSATNPTQQAFSTFFTQRTSYSLPKSSKGIGFNINIRSFIYEAV